MIRFVAWLRTAAGWRRALVLAAAGWAASLALPPTGLWPVLFLSFPILLCALDGIGERPLRRAFFAGWLFGLGYFASALHWIAFAFLVEAETYLWMMPFMVGALAGGMAIYWGIAAAAAKGLRLRGFGLAVGFSATLALAEILRGFLFTGFPWAAPGQVSIGMGAVSQLASIIGMTGLSLLIVLWACLPAAFLGGASRLHGAAAMAALLALPLCWWWGSARLDRAIPSHVPGVEIRIVQPNIAQEAKWRDANGRKIFDDLKSLSAAASDARANGMSEVTHLIWPESAVPFLIDESAVARDELRVMLGGRTTLITGSVRRDASGNRGARDAIYYNSIIVFDSAMKPVGRYDKWRLVPGGEFLPLAWLLEPLGFRKIVTVPGNFAAGPGARTLAVPEAPKAGFLVCYEAIFPNRLIDSAQRPDWIVNVTNDGWFGDSTGPHQHLAQARLRAIEQGLPIIRAANSGISAIIDGLGQVEGQLPLGARGVLDSKLPRPEAATLYARYGDWPAIAAALVLLCLAAFTRRSSPA